MTRKMQLLPDGTVSITEDIPNGERTTRYFDVQRQLKLTIIEKLKDKTIITKFNSDGYTVQSITIETAMSTKVYQKDGKTLIRDKELLPDGSENEHVYRQDGQTIERTTLYHASGNIYTTLYRPDGITPAQLIEQDVRGLSRISFYAANGQAVTKMIEDLSDGSTRTTLYKPDTHKIAQVETGPIKGAKEKNTYRIDFYDDTGSKIIRTTDEVRPI